MKNTKAIFLIILGSFILATGFAFAGGTAFDQLGTISKNGFDNRSGATPTLTATTGTPAASVTPAPAPKTDYLKKAKEFVGKNFDQIMAGAVIGVLAFMVVGTAGAGLALGFGAFAFFMLLKNL